MLNSKVLLEGRILILFPILVSKGRPWPKIRRARRAGSTAGTEPVWPRRPPLHGGGAEIRPLGVWSLEPLMVPGHEPPKCLE